MVSRSIIKGKPMKATGFSLISWSFIFLLVLGASAQQCGRQAGGALCSVGQCCSLWGWCGSTPDYCGVGCQSQCGRPTPTPTPLTPTTSPDGHKIGVCYGRIGDNLPHPEDVVKLYRSRNIGRMRIYDPDQVTLQSLKNSNIELMLGVPNQDLPNIANDANTANSWVQRNVRNYWPSVSFRYIAVGNEVTREPQFMQFVLPAMRNIYNALMFAGLQGQIKVSTAVDNGIVDKSFPPSTSVFRGELQSFMNPIICFLVSIRSPILFNVYPYFSYIGTANMKLSYALFTYPGTEFRDNNLNYQNLFDAIVDAAYSALEKAGGSSLEIVVSESGWPSAGGIATSMDNARTYNQNLINHVRTGTPKRPGRAVETYLFAMFNENLKNPESERNFGLFYPNTQPVYPWINSI